MGTCKAASEGLLRLRPKGSRVNRKETTDMKKIYVKPMAANVAFVVNENIAASIEIDNVTGSSLLNMNGEKCNEVFFNTGIATKLEPGVFDFLAAYDELEKATLAQIFDVLYGGNSLGLDKENYWACFIA